MAHTASADPALPTLGTRRGRTLASGRLVGLVTGAILLLLLILAIVGPYVTFTDPDAQDLTTRFVPPIWARGGSLDHLLGTDSLGRDILSRVIVGARVTLLIGLLGAALEAVIGTALGVVSGYFGGRVDAVVMRFTDVLIGMPGALIVLFIILIFGGSNLVIPLALALNGWMVFARVVRVAVMKLRTQAFIEAAVVSGVRPQRILRSHIIPHIRVTVLTVFLFEVPRLVLAESTLSFIGLGIQPPDISWGLMIGAGRSTLQIAPYPAIIPGVMIAITVVSMNLFSNWFVARAGTRDVRARIRAKKRRD